jgi:hypothetical protein
MEVSSWVGALMRIDRFTGALLIGDGQWRREGGKYESKKVKKKRRLLLGAMERSRMGDRLRWLACECREHCLSLRGASSVRASGPIISAASPFMP